MARTFLPISKERLPACITNSRCSLRSSIAVLMERVTLGASVRLISNPHRFLPRTNRRRIDEVGPGRRFQEQEIAFE